MPSGKRRTYPATYQTRTAYKPDRCRSSRQRIEVKSTRYRTDNVCCSWRRSASFARCYVQGDGGTFRMCPLACASIADNVDGHLPLEHGGGHHH